LKIPSWICIVLNFNSNIFFDLGPRRVMSELIEEVGGKDGSDLEVVPKESSSI
jgi:hypothetical protein